jgi:excisionase family DNA binding protein
MRLLNVAEIAVKLGRTEKAIRRLVERRQIPHLRIGRRVQFCEGTIDRWLARHARRGMTIADSSLMKKC